MDQLAHSEFPWSVRETPMRHHPQCGGENHSSGKSTEAQSPPRTAGFQPAVVIDAGLGDRLGKLQGLQELIARVTLVITYNRAGYGQSEPGPLPRDSGREAEELRAVPEKALVKGPYVRVGHSL